MTIHSLSARVINQSTLCGIPDLRVEAWDPTGLCVHLVAVSATDANGAFVMTLDSDYLDEVFVERRFVLGFRFFLAEEELIVPTFLWKIINERTATRFEVDLSAARGTRGPADSIVHGQVHTAVGAPVADVLVYAYDKTLTGEAALGNDATDAAGCYRITYSTYDRAGGARVNLVVRVFARTEVGGQGDLIAVSSKICNGPATAEVDVTTDGTYRGLSEYEILNARIAPEVATFNLAEATTTHVDHIVCSTGADRAQVTARVAAAVLNVAISAVAEASFYGLVREGLPSTRRELLQTPYARVDEALSQAVEKNTIPAVDGGARAAIVTALRAASVDASFEAPPAGGRCNLGDVLKLVLSDAVAREFLGLYLALEGDIANFWTALASVTSFQPAGRIATLQFILQMASLTRYHLPLIKRLLLARTNAEITSAADLAAMTEGDWADMIDEQLEGQVIGYPADIPGADAAEKKRTYARILQRTVEAAFPTAAAAAGLTLLSTQIPELTAVVTFLGANQAFDITATRLAQYLVDHPTALTGLSNNDRDAIVQMLPVLQRIYRIAPAASQVNVLVAHDFTSAHAIQQAGRRGFVSRLSADLGGEDVAEALFESACKIASGAQAIQAKYGPMFHGATLFALPNLSTHPAPNATKPMADWDTLFGSPDSCSCQHCRSVYGPAAYLVDLLQFLGRYDSDVVKVGTEVWTAKDVLIGASNGQQSIAGRRADIARIELSCDNTDTPLPYVDLVNEILEHAVATVALAAEPAWPSHIATTATAAELAAMPEIVGAEGVARNAAYEYLAARIYPWTLPFHFWQEEARVYLTHLGVPRHALMAMGASAAAWPNTGAVEAEQLGISPLERDILAAQVSPAQAPEAYWGMTAGTWATDLKRVSTFLERSGLSYEELTALISTQFMQGFGDNVRIEADDGKDGCNVDDLAIVAIPSNILAATWGTVQRFLRLWRRLGWSMADVDTAWRWAGASALTSNLLVLCAFAERARADTDTPLSTILTWFAGFEVIPTEGPSPYTRMFLDKTVRNPPDPAFTYAAVANLATTQTLAGHADVLTAVLRLSPRELLMLVDADVAEADLGFVPRWVEAPGKLLLDNILRVHNVATFSRALGISVRDLLVLQETTATFGGGAGVVQFTVAGATAFLELVRRMKLSGVTALDAKWLFDFDDLSAAPMGPVAATIDQMNAAFDSVNAAFEQIDAQRATASDPDGQKLAALLTRHFPDTTTEVQIRAMVDVLRGVASDPAEAIFDGSLANLFPDGAAAKPKFFGSDMLTDPAARLNFAFGEISVPLAREKEVIRILAADQRSDARTTRALLQALHIEENGADSLLRTLVTFVAPTPPVPSADWKAAYRSLHRMIIAVRKIGMTSSEVEQLIGPGKRFNLDTAMPGFGLARWLDLIEAWKAKALMSGDADRMVTIFSGTLTAAILSAASGWPEDDITALMTYLGLNFNATTHEVIVARLGSAFRTVKPLGVRAVTALRWTSASAAPPAAGAPQLSPPSADVISREIIQTVRSKYDTATWLTVAPPLRDVLREKQRKALVAYLLWKRSYADSGRLFADLLIDVDMCPCQLTSRIKQAIGSVQTFAQRAFMNLEASVTLPEDAAEEWRWRKNYRVWEANRKVFLYPENWIEPSLRDDKSPFFKALESELRQKEITSATSEDAFAHYLEKLDEVAHLEVAAMYHEVEPATDEHRAINVIHVVGRTQHSPVKFFYRRRVDAAHWTPWEPIDIDIPSEHLVLAAYERRVHLFWAVFEEKPSALQATPHQDEPGPPPRKQHEIQLGWSEYRNGKWTARRQGVTAKLIVAPVLSTPYFAFYFSQEMGESGPIRKIVCGYSTYKWDTANGPTVRMGSFLLGACGATIELADNDQPVFKITPNGTFQKAYWQNWHILFPTAPDRTVPRFQYDWQKHILNVLRLPYDTGSGTAWLDVLGETPTTFRVVAPHVLGDDLVDINGGMDVFFYKDANSAFFVEREETRAITWKLGANARPRQAAELPCRNARTVGTEAVRWASTPYSFIPIPPTPSAPPRYRFSTFYHPYACTFIRELNAGGVDGLLRRRSAAVQAMEHEILESYQPTSAVATPYPQEDVDFSFGGAYAGYNWEVFFHAPFLVATRLMQNQRFEEAQKWLHYIFDPTAGGTTTAPQRFWRLRPFAENKDLAGIQAEIEATQFDDLSPASKAVAALLDLDNEDTGQRNFAAQIAVWEDNPFNPHLIARMRPLAYQKAVVIKYIQNLIAWGDQLFRRDTIEAINEATQIYILAAELLGPRPRQISPPSAVEVQTYAEFEQGSSNDASGGVLNLEILVPSGDCKTQCGKGPPTPSIRPGYFCVPANDALLILWDTVADRLFKLRNCMNIEGVVRQLPLFEPPIDPALLVQATAAGVDLQSVLNDIASPIPCYRFSVMHGRAMEL